MVDMEKTDLIIKAFEAALDLAQNGQDSRAWASLTLIEIANHANIKMADLYNIADKDTLTDTLEGWADCAMSAEAADMDDTPRERLFDVIMYRFEHMEPHRLAILSLMKARETYPARLAALLKARRKSARWALACAGLDTGTPAIKTARAFGIAWVIAKTERAWRKDESGDFARTMATLDAELTSAQERFKRFESLSRFTPKTDQAATPGETSEPEARQGQTDPA